MSIARLRTLAALLVLVLLASACTRVDDDRGVDISIDAPTTTEVAEVDSADETAPEAMSMADDTEVEPTSLDETSSGDALSLDDASMFNSADPDNVVLALVILATGDIDEALAQGLVTEAEVDEAVAVIATDSVDLYLAEAAS